MAGARTERAYERYAWIILLVGGVFNSLGLFQMIIAVPPANAFQNWTGMTWDELATSTPKIANVIRWYVASLGRDSFLIGILSIAITLTSFRKGERWAWYFFWILPVWIIIGTVLQYVYLGVLDTLGFVGIIIVLLGLLLPYRKFFPRKQA